VSNLVDNAVRCNVPGGRVEVARAAGTTDATLTVAVTSTGPPVPADEVNRLPEPFQRAVPDRTASASGRGLGGQEGKLSQSQPRLGGITSSRAVRRGS